MTQTLRIPDPMPKVREIICDSCSEPAIRVPEAWSTETIVRNCARQKLRCDSCHERGSVREHDDGQVAWVEFHTLGETSVAPEEWP